MAISPVRLILRGDRLLLEGKQFTLAELHDDIAEDEIMVIQEMIRHLIFIFTFGGQITQNGLDLVNSKYAIDGSITARNEHSGNHSGTTKHIYIGPGSISQIMLNNQGKVSVMVSGISYILANNGFCAGKYLMHHFERSLGRKGRLGPESLINVLFTEVINALSVQEP